MENPNAKGCSDLSAARQASGESDLQVISTSSAYIAPIVKRKKTPKEQLFGSYITDNEPEEGEETNITVSHVTVSPSVTVLNLAVTPLDGCNDVDETEEGEEIEDAPPPSVWKERERERGRERERERK
mmetsp:Transcript_34995/g.35636  ORF Transcript_34995/g.35636 Transcript_34995/m.35636 type:complete len:128 (+) Transcript_34995:203-586(+)